MRYALKCTHEKYGSPFDFNQRSGRITINNGKNRRSKMKGRKITNAQIAEMNALRYKGEWKVNEIALIMRLSEISVNRYTTLDKAGNPPQAKGTNLSEYKKSAAKYKKASKAKASHTLNARKETFEYISNYANDKGISKIQALTDIVNRGKRTGIFGWFK